MLRWVQSRFESLFATADGPSRRPVLSKHRESNVAGLFIIGDLAGAPVIKLAMAQGHETIAHLAGLLRGKGDEGVLDVVIVGAGAAGLNAALEAQQRGLSYVLLEQGRIANTIENFPEGKWVYAEPDDSPARGKLWLDGARKEDLIRRWHEIVEQNRLDVRTAEPVTACRRDGSGFEITTPMAMKSMLKVP